MNSSDIRKLSDQDLSKTLDGKRDDFMRLRFQKVGGQLTDTSKLTKTRREIARILTVVREREIILLSESKAPESQESKS